MIEILNLVLWVIGLLTILGFVGMAVSNRRTNRQSLRRSSQGGKMANDIQQTKEATRCSKCGTLYGQQRSAYCRLDGDLHLWVTKPLKCEIPDHTRLASENERLTEALQIAFDNCTIGDLWDGELEKIKAALEQS